MMKRFSVSLISSIMAVSSVHAEATLSARGDGVMVNTGAGFVNVSGETPLRAGDLISISRQSKGTAELVYPDRCFVKIKPGDVTRVAKSSPCSFQALGEDGEDGGAGGSAGGALGGALGGINPLYAGGALVVAGGIVGGVVLATKPNAAPSTIPIIPARCASAGC